MEKRCVIGILVLYNISKESLYRKGLVTTAIENDI